MRKKNDRLVVLKTAGWDAAGDCEAHTNVLSRNLWKNGHWAPAKKLLFDRMGKARRQPCETMISRTVLDLKFETWILLDNRFNANHFTFVVPRVLWDFSMKKLTSKIEEKEALAWNRFEFERSQSTLSTIKLVLQHIQKEQEERRSLKVAPWLFSFT